MAIVKKKNSPYYYTRFAIKGVRIQESTLTMCKRDALIYEEKRRNDLRQEILLGIKTPKTWKDAEIRWLNESQHKRSLIDDKRHFNYIRKYFANKYLSELNKDIVEHLARKKENTGVSAATVNRMLALIKSVLNKAHKQWEWLNQVPYIRMRKEAAQRIRYLSKDEAHRLLNVLPEHLKVMVLFSLATGLRQSNVIQLKWRDTDLVSRRLKISGADFKNMKDFGIPLNVDAYNILQSQIGNNTIYVFTYKKHPVTTVTTKAWFKALKKANIVNFRWHDLRHTWASWFVQSGGSLQELQALGGWSSFNMVLKYAHLAPDNLRNAAERVSGILSGA